MCIVGVLSNLYLFRGDFNCTLSINVVYGKKYEDKQIYYSHSLANMFFTLVSILSYTSPVYSAFSNFDPVMFS